MLQDIDFSKNDTFPSLRQGLLVQSLIRKLILTEPWLRNCLSNTHKLSNIVSFREAEIHARAIEDYSCVLQFGILLK